MDCLFSDPRLTKQNQKQKQNITIRKLSPSISTSTTTNSKRIKLSTRTTTEEEELPRTKPNQELTSTKTQETTRIKTAERTRTKPEELTRIKTEETTRIKTAEITRIKTAERTRTKTEETTRTKTEETTRTHEITKNQDNEIETRTLNHQDYQSHPIIPRPTVDKTICAYSSSHPLHQPNPSPERKLISSSKLVNSNRNSFKLWFTNHSFDPINWPFKPKIDPQIRVIYPTGAHELFPLLVPKNENDEYRPIDDLLNVITTTLTYYLTPHQSSHFFSEPHPITSISTTNTQTNFNFLNRKPASTTPEPTSSSSSSSSPKIPNLNDPSLDLSSKPLLKELTKSIKRKNGIEFIKLIGWYNRVIKHLIETGSIRTQIRSFTGIPQGISETIIGQTYDRVVGPSIELLQGYETWSSNVYGELKPNFVSEIIRLVDLKPGQIFVDLGSGIGNIVLQVALEVGCLAVGFEIMDGPAVLASKQQREIIGRSHALWGLNLGPPILIKADFTKDSRVGQWLRQADVVLVNNQVFTPDLNESLSLLFLELKEGTKIVSLKPFISTSFKLNQRNLDSPLAILTRPTSSTMTTSTSTTMISNTPGVFRYPPNSVSWTDNPGEFFLSVVDRSKLIQFQSTLISDTS
ncbi:hypothetical protein MJO28_016352 [Puccinia striiformis f. sp. tritici]|uniref:Histone-lysine N-methyltransferase, H3 lysine-79 specific n=2 Tax=Puccinia striiformis f. sp. tritici TaxID=168172 RepID=A0A0L0VZA0_9BASI|nr:hypothetical protein Pst134EA_030521 [Puccinia striiformis f. sp. tritici]KAI9600566.1 hypothetical protein H4Q26_000353 [Puccinia striiformis f. sp. tritici PST-130]KNF04624.1 hypothetical protein PSTG_02112 [Puccinia striiformis f. sp. tritici PST-78]KAH9440450.1 hypothetical protein Pst134EB_031062 [Puccinia striiformis f. sp. tritici]KAH9446610.1 hypothetical protein Pst134EA_030521 [Puccinia striiformis f. sp. tritici]KAI7935010.1 hypothetical protein MJO29_016273 [Puccinia striiformis